MKAGGREWKRTTILFQRRAGKNYEQSLQFLSRSGSSAGRSIERSSRGNAGLQGHRHVRDEVSARNYERQEGIKQGIEQGIKKERNAIISRLKRKGYTEDQITELLSE